METGTYSPFLLVLLRSVSAAAIMWAIAVAGIGLSIAGKKGSKAYGLAILTLFLAMGWSGAVRHLIMGGPFDSTTLFGHCRLP